MRRLLNSVLLAAIAFVAVAFAPSAMAQQTTCYDVVKQSYFGTLDLEVCVTQYEGGGEIEVGGTLTLRDGSVVEIDGAGVIKIAVGSVNIAGEVTISYGGESWTVPINVTASTLKKATSQFVSSVTRLAL